jgi:hypothetical protein
MKHELPAPFIAFLVKCMHHRNYRSAKQLHRFLVIRLALWRDGESENSIPGYSTPPPDGPHGYPVGWSIQALRELARECEADIHLSIRRGFRALSAR